MKPTYNLIVRTFEEGRKEPVVTHVFHGDAPKQARAFYKAHCKSDAFLRECGVEGRFGDFRCHNVVVGMFYKGQKVGPG